jgi:hypothetical protein
MMTIKYTNEESTEVTLQQSMMLTKYFKIYSIDNLVKKEEFFKHQQLASITYYKDLNETDAQILSNFQSLKVELVITERIQLSAHTLLKSIIYNKEGVVMSKFNTLYDSNGELLCEETIDLDLDEPMYDQTLKTFYNRTVDPENEIFDCKYNEDGKLDYIRYNAYSYQDSIWFAEDGRPGKEDIPTLCEYVGLTMAEMEYYLTATLLP